MVRIGDIDPDSLLTVSAADLAAAPPVVSAQDLAAAKPVRPPAPIGAASDTVSLSDLHAAQPLNVDQQLAVEGRTHAANVAGAYRVELPPEQANAIEPDAGLRIRYFGRTANPEDYLVSAPGGPSGPPLSDPEKQALLQQLQRANGVYETANTQRALERGAGYGPDNLGGAAAGDIIARTAQEEAAHEGALPTAGSQFAHGMSNVMAAALVDPARIVTGMETPDQQRARLQADRALQQAQEQQYPITAGVARGVGQVVSPESIAAMGVLGPAAAPLRAAAAGPIARTALTAAEGGAYGGAVLPLQNAAAGEAVTPGTVARDATIGAAGALAGSAAAGVAGHVLGNAAPITQAVGKFAAGGVASGAVNTGAAAGSAALQGRDYSANDAVRDFITGAALHVPGGVPDAIETLQAARDRLRQTDPSNSIVPRLDAEIARHATQEPSHEQAHAGDTVDAAAAGQLAGPAGGRESGAAAGDAAVEPARRPAVGESVAPVVAGAGTAAGGEPRNAPVTPPAAADHLPPVPEGMTRFYSGGVPGEGPRWVTPDYQYARGYAGKNANVGGDVVQYVDVPNSHPLVRDAVDVSGTNMVSPKDSFEAPPDLMRGAKIVPPVPAAAPAATPFDAEAFSRRKSIEDHIVEGQSILDTGSYNGRRFSDDELAAVRRAVANDKAKLAALPAGAFPERGAAPGAVGDQPGGPLTVEPRPGLEPDQRAVEQELTARINGPEADALYDRIPDAHGGKVIGTDIARLMHPAYETTAGRERYTSATSRAAGAYAADRLAREIDNPPPPRPGRDRPLLLFTAGGVASGKSSVVSDAMVDRADLVSDGQMKDPRRAIGEINQALQAGWDVHVQYVHRPFPLAVRGAIDRAAATGRWGPLADLPGLHMQAQDSLSQVARHFADNPRVQVRVAINDGTAERPAPARDTPVARLESAGDLRYTDRGALEKVVQDEIQRARESGHYPTELLDRLAGGPHDAGAIFPPSTAQRRNIEPGPAGAGPTDSEQRPQGQKQQPAAVAGEQGDVTGAGRTDSLESIHEPAAPATHTAAEPGGERPGPGPERGPGRDSGGVAGGSERPGGERTTETGSAPGDAAAGDRAAKRKAAVDTIRQAASVFKGVRVRDAGDDGQGGGVHLVMPDGGHVPWKLSDKIRQASVSSFLKSIRAANDDQPTIERAGRRIALPETVEAWDALPKADQRAIRGAFEIHGRYNPKNDTITSVHQISPARAAEEIFHAQSKRLREASPSLYERMIARHSSEDLAFREFWRDVQARRGLTPATAPALRAQYFRRIRAGLAHVPYEHGAKTAAAETRARDEATLVAAAQNDGVLMSDAEFENFVNDRGGLSPDTLDGYQKINPKTGREYPIHDAAGRLIIEPDQLSREGKVLYPFVDEAGHGSATEGMDAAGADRYADRLVREVLMSRQEKVEEAARYYRDAPDAHPELKAAAQRILGDVQPAGEDLPFATEKKSDGQLTLVGEQRGRETMGGTGDLFGDLRPGRKAAVLQESQLPAGAEKFRLSPEDMQRATAFSEGEPSAAFAYGVRRALDGHGVAAVEGMTPAEAKEALAGNKAARDGMSPAQRQHAQSPSPAAAQGQEPLYATERRPEEEPKTKVAPNVTRSAAILAAAKVLRSVDHELFDAPPHTSDVPLRVSKSHLQEALDQVGRDFALDPAALEKYRQPVEAEARKLLARARRAGSFDAALASLQEAPARGSVKEAIRGSTQSADPEKIILSAKDAVRQAMRLREQGRSEGLREAVKLRQAFIQEASKYLAPDERGPLMKDLAAIGNEADLYARLQKIYTAFDKAQKHAAADDVRDLIRGADTKHMRPEFKSAMEALTGDLDKTKMSERTRERAQSLANYMQTLPAEERAALPDKAHALLDRLAREPLESFSVEDLHDLGDSIRAIVTQNQLKNKLIAGKHLRDLGKAERQTVQEVLKAHKPLGTVGEEGKRKLMGDKSLAGKLVEYTDSPEVLAVSAGGEGGEVHTHTYEALRQAEDDHLGRMRQHRGEIQALLAKHGMTPEKIIAWREQTRRVQLSALPRRPEPRARGGLDALSDAERQARDQREYFDGTDEARKDAAARAVGESIEPGGGPRAQETARATRQAGGTEPPVPETNGSSGDENGPVSGTKPASDETRSIELTGPEALSAWLYDQNPDAREKLLSNPVNLERFAGQSPENRTLQPADLRAITDTLTPFERELGKVILEQNRQLGEGIGGVHLQLKGYELPREDNYFPLLTDQKQKQKVLDELAGKYADKWLEQSGFLKERVRHRVPILLSDALDTHLWHLRQASSFISKAVPVRNARILLGSPRVREAIDSHVGKTWTPRMEGMLKDFGGADWGPKSDAQRIAGKLSRNLAAATLGLRPTSVAVNHVGAALMMLTQMKPEERAAFVKKFINLKGSTIDSGKYFDEHVAPHSPYLADRYDPRGAHRVAVTGAAEGGGGGIPTAKTAGAQKWRDFQEWALSFISKAERVSAVSAHKALLELNPEMSPAEAADRVEKMVRRTQPAVSSLDMSQFSREVKSNPAMGLAFMFTSQAAKARDVLRMAALKYQRSGRTASDRAALAGAGAAVFGSMVLAPAVIRSLWSQVRQGGQEPEENQLKGVGEHLSDAVGSLGDIAHPVIGGLWRELTKGSDETLNNRALAQIHMGLQGLYKGVAGDGKGESSVLARTYAAIAGLSRGIASVSGVPLDAPLSLAEGVGRAIAGRPPEFHIEQEEKALRKVGSPTAEQKARLAVLGHVTEHVARIRKLQREGALGDGAAESTIQGLLQAAGSN